jgi:AraC-like DNA-binding protein/ligand-binding sensor protein
MNLSNLRTDMVELENVFQSLYMLTEVKMTLYDNQHREIYTYPPEQSRFCYLVRGHKIDCCNLSDEYGFDLCRRSDGPVSYHCHAGLIEVIFPMKQNGEIMGYIMFGQMLPSGDYASTRDQFCTKFRNLCDEETLQNALSQLTVWNDAQLQAAMVLMKVCISYLLSHQIVFTEKGQIIEQLNSYINAHLDSDLTPEMISNYLNMSRTTLYSLTKKLLGTGIMSYVRQRRIEAAKTLLVSTDLSLAEIAIRVGFSDYNYFLRVFKQYTGLTCKSYKKQADAREKSKGP